MTKSYLETDYVRSFLKQAAVRIPYARGFRRNTGAMRTPDGERYFKASLKGQCDLYFLTKGGLHLEVECKRFGVLTPDQIAWREWCKAWGVPWMLLEVHKSELPSITIARWCDEVSGMLARMAKDVG